MKGFAALITLTLTCLSHPQLVAAAATPRLFLVGDSTLSIKSADKRPETGWGEKLVEYVRPPLQIHNHARNGRSSKSFREEGLWQVVLDALQPGDFVFIQFGHNDQKVNDPTRFTNPYSSYRANLRRYVEEVRAAKATPLLLSSIVRRNFNAAGTLVDSHGPYPAVMRQLARDLEVEFIDLHTLSEQLVSKSGVERSRDLFLHLPAATHPNYPEGVADNTHLNPAGADAIAGLVVKELCQRQHPLHEQLRNCSYSTNQGLGHLSPNAKLRVRP
ncbi:MAG: rhamnogalacturonan acetylesterase [Gammaproteobacteria bacterium]|nr:rhamnogalacturonan acetylesterase [Gammaproteobacteria bacterium]